MKGYNIHTRTYIKQDILAATTPEIQVFLAHLLFGLISTSSVGDKRVGRTFFSISTVLDSDKLCLGYMPDHHRKIKRLIDNAAYSRLGKYRAIPRGSPEMENVLRAATIPIPPSGGLRGWNFGSPIVPGTGRHRSAFFLIGH